MFIKIFVALLLAGFALAALSVLRINNIADNQSKLICNYISSPERFNPLAIKSLGANAKIALEFISSLESSGINCSVEWPGFNPSLLETSIIIRNGNTKILGLRYGYKSNSRFDFGLDSGVLGYWTAGL